MAHARVNSIVAILLGAAVLGGCSYYRTGTATLQAGASETTVTISDKAKNENYAVSIALRQLPSNGTFNFPGNSCIYTTIESRATDQFVVAARDCGTGDKVAPASGLDFDWIIVDSK